MPFDHITRVFFFLNVVCPVVAILFFIFLYKLLLVLHFFFEEVLIRAELIQRNLYSRTQKFYVLLFDDYHRKSINWVRAIQRLPGVKKRIPYSVNHRGIYRVIFNFYVTRHGLLQLFFYLLFIVIATIPARAFFIDFMLLLFILDLILVK